MSNWLFVIIIVSIILSPFFFDFVKSRREKKSKNSTMPFASPLLDKSLQNALYLRDLYKDILNAPTVRSEMDNPPSSCQLRGEIKWDAKNLEEFVKSVDDVLRQGLDLSYVRIFDKKYLDRLEAYALLRGFKAHHVPNDNDGFWELETFRGDLKEMI